jgi:hypothetical protein
LFRAQPGLAVYDFLVGRFHLSLYRLTFPTSGHVTIIRARVAEGTCRR